MTQTPRYQGPEYVDIPPPPRPPKQKGTSAWKVAIGVALGLFLFMGCTIAVITGAVNSVDTSSPSFVDTDNSPMPDEDTDASAFTVSQEQAIEQAQSYINMTGFSKAGLMEQMTSDAGSGFSKSDASFALKHIKVDWNAEAVESAQGYLDISSFSRSGLIDQLHSKAGSGYTLKQAEYAADQVGLK